MEERALIFHCSHRPRGNSNTAANLFLQGIEGAGGQGDIIRLSRFKIEHCNGCNICRKVPQNLNVVAKCPLSAKDYVPDLFDMLFAAPVVFFTSPIYFYHLPSHLKTFIDRSQEVWARREKNDPAIVNLPKRKAYACLVAGRDKGDKLFEGSILTLKYFLEPFNIELADTLTFRGVDKVGDLTAQQEMCDQITQLGAKAWQELGI